MLKLISILFLFHGWICHAADNSRNNNAVPWFEIEVRLSDGARELFKRAGETIIVDASFYGATKPQLPEGFLGSSSIELKSEGVARFDNARISTKGAVLIDPDFDVNVTVTSGRKSSDVNLWTCDFISKRMSAMKNKRHTVNCQLIKEKYPAASQARPVPQAAAPAPAAKAGWGQPQSFGSWQVGASYTNGQFDGCLAAAQGGSGMLIVGQDRDGRWGVVVPDAGLSANSKAMMEHQYNWAAKQAAQVEIDNDHSAIRPTSPSDPFLTSPVTVYQVWLNKQRMVWQLTQTKDAMAAVRRCHAESRR